MALSTFIGCPSPRDVIAFKESISTIDDCDMIYAKYWPEEYAYSIIEDYYLNHTDADYLVITPDDLLAAKYHRDQLVSTIEKYGKENMPTLAGVCNVHNIPGYTTQLAICVDRPISPIRRQRNYKWADLRQKGFRDFIEKKDRIQVKFSGFPFQFIRRDIVHVLGLKADLSYNPNHRIREGYSIDVVFCHQCNEQGIPLYINPWVQMLHLRGSSNKDYPGIQPMKVYHEEPKVLLKRAGQKEEEAEDITHMYAGHLRQFNESKSMRSTGRIVPNPRNPDRLTESYENVLNATVPRQDARSAGCHPIRQRRSDT